MVWLGEGLLGGVGAFGRSDVAEVRCRGCSGGVAGKSAAPRTVEAEVVGRGGASVMLAHEEARYRWRVGFTWNESVQWVRGARVQAMIE